jgi:hypothetical protein
MMRRQQVAGVRLRVLRTDQGDVYRDIARVPEQFRTTQKGKIIPEGSVCRLSSGKRTALAVVRGKSDRESENAIWLDERLRNRLDLQAGAPAEIHFKPVWFLGGVRWAWNASDLAYRSMARLAVGSVALGVIGLALGIVGFVMR